MKKIYLNPAGGLSNRMRAIDSVLSIANECGKRLVVIWEKNWSLNCAFQDLFLPSASFDVIETKPFAGWAFPFFPTSRPKSLVKRKLFHMTCNKFDFATSICLDELAEHLKPLQPVTPEKYRQVNDYDDHIYRALGDVAEKLKQNESCYVSTCWRIVRNPRYGEVFQPSVDVGFAVASITRQFDDQTFGVHIRGTDAEQAKRHSDVHAFEDRIQSVVDEMPGATFFLASDEPAIKRRLIDKYPSRIFTFDQTNYERTSPENIRNALVDLLCLASTCHIFGSYFSTFSQVAADWKGIEDTTVFRRNAIARFDPTDNANL